MKPGDIVWVFDGYEICSYILNEISERGHYTFRTEDGLSVIHPGFYGPIFPTREALCEHYRKVFE